MEKLQEEIDFIERQLNSKDPETYTSASFILLKRLRENTEEIFFEILIESDVMRKIIQIINPESQGYILESLKIITESNVILKNDIVDKIIASICKCNFESSEEATIAVNIIYKILAKVFELKKSQGISLIEKYAAGLFNFITQSTFAANALLSVTKLLNLIISYSTQDFQQTYFPAILRVYYMAIDLIQVGVDSNLERMRTICCISNSLINLCYEIDGIYKADQEILFDKITIEKIIPELKNLEINIESAKDIIDFLESVISLEDCNIKEVCSHLIKNGYLIYLLQLSVLEPESTFFRLTVCRVISEIIITLQENFEFPIKDWPGGFIGFKYFLCNGLKNLPIDMNEWEDLLKNHDQNSNSLLIVLYCHFIATNEKYMFTRKSLAIKLKSVSRSGIKPIFLKALWLLYSVSSLVSEMSDSSSNLSIYSGATESLASTLQKENSIELLYTHHEGLFLYSMKEIGIPKRLRIKVVRLWLNRSNSDEEFDVFVKESLDQGYDELKIVKILMDLIYQNSMENLNKIVKIYGALLKFREVIPENVVEFVLTTLANELANYTPTNSEILKIVLKLSCTLPSSKSLPTKIVRECAMGIKNLVIREDTDLILKTLLITAGAFSIRQSLVLKDSKVSKIFLTDDEFVKQVWCSTLSSKNVIMTQVCIRALTCLIFCQDKFKLQGPSVLEVKSKELEKLLVKLEEENCSQILGVELIKLILLKSTTNNPLFVLHKLEKNKDLNHIFNVYFLIHTVHDKAIAGKEEETYQCLSTMLNYCYTQKLNINIFLTCSATPILIEIAIERIHKSQRLSLNFIEFATTWLRYRQYYRILVGMKFKSLFEKSAALLIEFKTIVTKMDNSDSCVVQDFCTVVDNYLKNY